jgi:hypothetical protein
LIQPIPRGAIAARVDRPTNGADVCFDGARCRA